MKKIVTTVLMLTMTGLLFAQNTLNVWSCEDYMGQNKLKQLCYTYEEVKDGVELNVNIMPRNNFSEELDKAFKSGSGIPDVFGLNQVNVENFIKTHEKDLLDLTDIYESVKDKIIVTDMKPATRNGKVYALCFETEPVAFFYKRSLAKKYLGTDEPEEVQKLISNWNDFIRTASIIKQKSDNKCRILNTYDPYILIPYFRVNEIEMCADTCRYLCADLVDKFTYFGCFSNPGDWKFQIDTSGDWAMIQGPVKKGKGVVWVAASKNTKYSADVKNFIKDICFGDEVLLDYARQSGAIVLNKNVAEQIAEEYNSVENNKKGKTTLLGGQNAYKEFAEIGKKVDFSAKWIEKESDYELITEIALGRVSKEEGLKLSKKGTVKKDFVAELLADEFKNSNFVKIPNRDFAMLKTEVTQKLYAEVMGENPSQFVGDNKPVEYISWYDAVYFCNKLSRKYGLKPVYAVNGQTDESKWGYKPHKNAKITSEVVMDKNANGFRLPLNKEIRYAAKGGKKYKYAGSDNVEEVAWVITMQETLTTINIKYETHPVAQKKPNDYGLYDLSGNVSEWIWDQADSKNHMKFGGDVARGESMCEIDNVSYMPSEWMMDFTGLRLVYNLPKEEKKPEVKPEAKKEAPKAEEKKAEVKKEAPKAEEKKAEVKKEAPKAEEKKAEVKKEAPKAEEKKAEAKKEEPKAEEKKPEAKKEAPKVEEKKAEVKKEAPKAEEKKPEVKKEAPKVEEKKAEAKKEAPKVEEKKAEVKKEEPKAEEKKAEVKKEEPKVVEKKAEAKKEAPKAEEKKAEVKKEEPKVVEKKPEPTPEELLAAKTKKFISESFVKIPGKNFMMLKTEVTQKLYAEVMGANPSKNKGDDKPVTNISWYDAIYFCNKLSEKYGRTPVYSLHGSTDVSKWGYKPHKRYDLDWDGIEQNKAANGFRLPANSEWEYAALGGKNFEYAGSNNPYEVAWFNGNSGNKIHPVAKLNPNKYGLYDMSGNVWEWVWDTLSGSDRYCRGGSYTADDDDEATCTIKNWDSCEANEMHESIGFRVICNNVN